MTTDVKVTSRNFPVLVETFDNGTKTDERVYTVADGEQTFYCTTSRQLRISDVEYNDPRVPAPPPEHAPPEPEDKPA